MQVGGRGQDIQGLHMHGHQITQTHGLGVVDATVVSAGSSVGAVVGPVGSPVAGLHSIVL